MDDKWQKMLEDHEAAYFNAEIALEDIDSYSLEEKKAIVEKMEKSTEEIDEAIRADFMALPPEGKKMMLELLGKSEQGLEWWENLLFEFDKLPDSPPDEQ